MPIYHPLTYHEDCETVPLGNLVVLHNPSHSDNAFALACDNAGERMFALLSHNDVVAVPFVARFGGACVSLGSDFTIGFDPVSIVVDAQPQLGNLVLTKKGLYLRAHREESRTRFGGACWIELASGAIHGVQSGATITTWSLSVDAWKNGKQVKIFERPTQ